MTIFTEVRTGRSVLEDIQAPLGDVLSVTAEEAWLHSPLSSSQRMLELRGANQGFPVGVGSDTGDIQFSEPSPMLSADDARTRIKEEGLSLTVPDSGIRRDALDILIKRKSDERRRKDIMARGPSGVGPAMAGFGTALAVSMLDPLNVASAFVPVVGPARYGRMIEQAGGALGRMGVRARVGAVEGAVGAAVVEPIVLAAASQEQADYGLNDTLLNIALGTALGGGLHVGIGAASDALAKRAAWQQARATEPLPRILEQVPPEAREAALRVAVSQAMTGRAVDVEPVIRAYHGSPHDFDRFDMSRIGTGEGAQAYGHGLYFAESEGVAQSYALALAKNRVMVHAPDGVIDTQRHPSASVRLAGRYLEEAGDPGRAIANLEKTIGQGLGDDLERFALNHLRTWREYRIDYPTSGRMYEVAIRADKDKFLDWDKPLSEQAESVRNALLNHPDPMIAGTAEKWGHDIGAMLGRIGQRLDGGKAAVSAALREVGIPGIKYFDAGSRVTPEDIALKERTVALTRENVAKAQGDMREYLVEALARQEADLAAAKNQTRNLVLFDDNLVDIVAKDGQPVRSPDMAAESQKSFAPENARMVDMDAVRIGDEKIASAAANDDKALEESVESAIEDVRVLARAMMGEEGNRGQNVQPPHGAQPESTTPSVPEQDITPAERVKAIEPDLVAIYNKELPSVKDQYYKFAAEKRQYNEIDAKAADDMFGPKEDGDWPPELQAIIEKHGRAVEIVDGQDASPQWFAPNAAPTREQFMRDAVEAEGGLLPARDLDDVMRGLETRTEGAETAASYAFAHLAESMGWRLGRDADRGGRYFEIEKVGPDGHAVILNVRISDHGQLTRSNPNAVTPDINLAPGAHDFVDAAEVMQRAVASDGAERAAGSAADDLIARELKPLDDLTETAEAYGRAVIAAANCGLRRG